MEDEKVFSDCEPMPPGSRNASGLFDFSQSTFTMDENGIYIEGNVTSVWNVHPRDVVKAELSLSYFDRGSWVPTILNLAPKDLCKVLYDKKQYWYIYWFSHVTNAEDVKDKCLYYGTTFIFEPFYFNIFLGLDMPLRGGRYLINIGLTAHDPNGIKREDTICMGMRGDLNKIL
ncbi:uncharacterized protein [Drosophila kikkawai]|uniref:Uncharacterized protein n=1 Tax=Drosophila kikkawai TaxID=30033 RepID=A0A6P4JLJ8_DROKI|nr:uncharacterized protein LOC108084006 [Drosophila kikkawai]